MSSPAILRSGRSLSLVATAVVLLMYAPALTRNLWIARLVATEVSPLVAVAALGGLIALRKSAFDRVLTGLAAGSLIASLFPTAITLSEFKERGRSFSLVEYLTWGTSAVPRPIDVTRDLVLEPSLKELRVDLYRGTGDGPRPLIVLVHGGSFSGGDKGENQTVSKIYAASGYAVADLQYRLAPTHRFPDAVEDVKCLAGRLRERAAEFHIDTNRVVYMGRSAGGAIAIVAAYSAGDSRLPPSCGVNDLPVSSVVMLYSPLDLEWGWRIRAFPDPIVGYKALERYIGGTPLTDGSAFRLASATSWVSEKAPPTLLIHGTRDSLVSPYHGELLSEAFLRRGLPPPKRLLVPFADHGFDYHPGGLGEQLARAEILEFLESSLPKKP